MKVLILDGHPDEGRLVSHLLDIYAAALPGDCTVTRTFLRDLRFGEDLRRGYAADQAWEPDLEAFARALTECDHLVIGFPLWWGGEPARLKGLLDRVILPGFAFRYHRGDASWDRLLAGRSADLIVTMDTPPWYLRLVYGDPVVRRWRSQILGFCGFKPIRAFRFGPTRRGGAAGNLRAWEDRVRGAAKSCAALRRGRRMDAAPDRSAFSKAVEARRS